MLRTLPIHIPLAPDRGLNRGLGRLWLDRGRGDVFDRKLSAFLDRDLLDRKLDVLLDRHLLDRDLLGDLFDWDLLDRGRGDLFNRDLLEKRLGGRNVKILISRHPLGCGLHILILWKLADRL